MYKESIYIRHYEAKLEVDLRFPASRYTVKLYGYKYANTRYGG